MKNKILHNATDMFLNIGFKSITMDDIATNSGISKKTIYAHFSNKIELVQAVTLNMFDVIKKVNKYRVDLATLGYSLEISVLYF